MKKLFILFLLLVSPALAHDVEDKVLRESFYKIEVNHFYDEFGVCVFDQMIFYDEPTRWGNVVVSWVLLKDSRGPLANAEYFAKLNQYKDDLDKGKYNNQSFDVDKILGREYQGSQQFPISKNWKTGKYEIFCILNNENTVRKFTTASVVHTYTQYDPELVERETLDKEKRRGFLPEKKNVKTNPNIPQLPFGLRLNF